MPQRKRRFAPSANRPKMFANNSDLGYRPTSLAVQTIEPCARGMAARRLAPAFLRGIHLYGRVYATFAAATLLFAMPFGRAGRLGRPGPGRLRRAAGRAGRAGPAGL